MNRAVLPLWLGLGFALSTLGGALALDLYLEYQHTVTHEQERLSTQTRVIAENIEHQLASANLALENVRDELPHWKGPSKQQEIVRSLKALTNAMTGISYMSVMDANGIVTAANRPEFIGRNLGYRPYFQAAQQHPDTEILYVSPPFKSLLGHYVITVTRMIPGPHGEFSGIVTATLDPEYFKTLMLSVLYTPDMWDAIVHGDGRLFLMVPEREGVQGMDLTQPGTLFMRHRESGQLATVLTGMTAATKELRMMALRTVHPESLKMDKPLVVSASRDLDLIFQPWRRDALTKLSLFTLAVIVAILGLYAFQRYRRLFEEKTAEAAVALQQSAERLQLAAEASGVGVWDYDLVTGALVWDDAMYRIYGIDKTVSNLHEAWHNSLFPEDQVIEATALKVAIEQNTPYACRFRIYRSDGTSRTIQARARLHSDVIGKPVRMVGTNEDITERQQQETAMLESEERFRSTFDAAPIGMALVSLNGQFLGANNALSQIVGYSLQELRQKTFQDITHPEDLETDLDFVKQLLAGTRNSYQMEKRYFHKGGQVIWVLLSASAIRDAAGHTLYFVSQIQDITERKELLKKLETQAHEDYLTGLSNRRYFAEQGDIELARARRYGKTLSLFMLDIDHFKYINDTYGHKTGDIVLQRLSDILRDTVRTFDIIGRIGGEEFAVVLPETDLQKTIEVAERLREIIARSEVALGAGLPLHFTVSIGVATLGGGEVNLDMLLNLADLGLYQAKREGRNKVCVATN